MADAKPVMGTHEKKKAPSKKKEKTEKPKTTKISKTATRVDF